MHKIIQDVLDAEVSAIQNISAQNPFEEVVGLLLDAKSKGGKVVVSGVGKAGEVGKKIAVTFCSVGLPSVFLHPLEAQHGDLGLLHDQDVMLLISNSGQTREVLELEALAKNLVPQIKTVCLTGKNQSALALKSDLVLWTGDPAEACPLGLTPTTSTTTMTVIGDVLAVLVIEMSGYGAKEYSLRHHGGYLGTKAKERTSLHLDSAPAIDLQRIYAELHKENRDFQSNNWLFDEIPHLITLPITSLVELGCGNGRFALSAANHFENVIAIDWAVSPVIEGASKPANLEYLIADVTSTNIPNASAIVSADFFENLHPADIRPLIQKSSDAGQVQFHKIACYPDSRGLHLTVLSPQGWIAHFKKVDPNFAISKIEFRRNRQDQPVVTICR